MPFLGSASSKHNYADEMQDGLLADGRCNFPRVRSLLLGELHRICRGVDDIPFWLRRAPGCVRCSIRFDWDPHVAEINTRW